MLRRFDATAADAAFRHAPRLLPPLFAMPPFFFVMLLFRRHMLRHADAIRYFSPCFHAACHYAADDMLPICFTLPLR